MRSFKSVLFVIFVAALTVNLTGCKDDDDDKTASEKIVGTWYDEGDPDYMYVFNADGTGAAIDVSDGIYEPFTYAYNDKAGTLRILWSNYGDEDNAVVTMDGNKMYCSYHDGEFVEVFVRG